MQTELGELLNRMLGSIALPYLIHGHTIKISMSLGATIFPNDNTKPDALLSHADAALYLAKQAGRNRYKFYVG